MDELLPTEWLSELELDDPAVINQWQLKSFKDTFANLCTNQYLSTEIVPEASQAGISQPAEPVKNNDLSTYTSVQKTSHDQEACPSPSTQIISFEDLKSPPIINTDDLRGNLNCNHVKNQLTMMPFPETNFSAPISPGSMEAFYGAVLEFGEPSRRGDFGTQLQTQEHVLAERKRRERLTELFISLSTIIPGLKKLDKASVLGGAIEYLKQLEERIKVLEEGKKIKYEKTVQVSSKRPRLSTYDQSVDSSRDQSSPEIEVRTRDGNVLLGVHCKKRPGIIKGILSEIEKLPLCIINTSVMPFGNTMLHVTIIAQDNGEFCMRAQDLAQNIQRTILKLAQ